MHYRVLHECKNKADLGKELNKTYENYIAAKTESNEVQDLPVKILAFDGMAIVRSLKKESWVRTCKDLAQLFLEKVGSFFINKVYNVVCMIFDPYTSGQLAKIRNTKDVGESKLYYEVADNTNIERVTLKNFLSNDATTRDLTLYFSKKFLHHFSGRFTHNMLLLIINLLLMRNLRL